MNLNQSKNKKMRFASSLILIYLASAGIVSAISSYGDDITITGYLNGLLNASSVTNYSCIPKTGYMTVCPNSIIKFDNGSTLSVTGTSTLGIQEAVNEANTTFKNVRITGGKDSGGSQFQYHIGSGGVVLPALQGFTFELENALLISTNSTATLTIDTCMMCNFELKGQILNDGTGYPIRFNPTSSKILDNFAAIIDSNFFITTVAGQSSANRVQFDCINAGCTRNTFVFGEVNGGNNGIVIPSTGIFAENKLFADHLHSSAASFELLQIGNNASGGHNYYNVHLSGEAASGELIRLNDSVGSEIHFSGGGTYAHAIIFGSAANNNMVYTPLNWTTTTWTDNTANRNYIFAPNGTGAMPTLT